MISGAGGVVACGSTHITSSPTETDKLCPIEYRAMTEKGLFKQSFGRVGKCLDNRPIEYFFSIFKTEFWRRIKTNRVSIKEIRAMIKKWVYKYNNEFIQGCLNNLSPVEYKQALIK